jgi:hypothetical protein
LIFIWAILYLAYTSIFATRLLSWNYNHPGHCYNPSGSSNILSFHPAGDRSWISLWSVWVFTSLAMAYGLERGLLPVRRVVARGVLLFAAVQGPFHAYTIFTLRKDNEALLTSGFTEQQWGFGQTVAMILLGTNIIVLVNGIQGTFCCMLRFCFYQGLENSKLMLFVRLSRMEDRGSKTMRRGTDQK